MPKETKYVLIIGSSNMDLNIYSKRFPNPGETVTGGTFKQFLGGKGANQAVASVRSGSTTYFIGKIGTDNFGNQMISQLSKEGIEISHVIRDNENASGVAFILIDENGENMISVAPGSNFNLSIEEIKTKEAVIKNAHVLVVQMEIPIKTIERVIKIASKGNVVKILNPAPLKPIPIDILKKLDIIIPNRGELFQLYSFLNPDEELQGKGESEIIKASKRLVQLGIKTVITTLGDKGCLIYFGSEDKVVEIPSPKVNAVDTVGAGDCFIGALASRINQGEHIVEAVKFATIAASIAVKRKGAQDSMPFLNEIEENLENSKKNGDI